MVYPPELSPHQQAQLLASWFSDTCWTAWQIYDKLSGWAEVFCKVYVSPCLQGSYALSISHTQLHEIALTSWKTTLGWVGLRPRQGFFLHPEQSHRAKHSERTFVQPRLTVCPHWLLIHDIICSPDCGHPQLLEMELDVLYSYIASPSIVANFPAFAKRIVKLPQGPDIIVGIHTRLLKETHPSLFKSATLGPSSSFLPPEPVKLDARSPVPPPPLPSASAVRLLCADKQGTRSGSRSPPLTWSKLWVHCQYALCLNWFGMVPSLQERRQQEKQSDEEFRRVLQQCGHQ